MLYIYGHRRALGGGQKLCGLPLTCLSTINTPKLQKKIHYTPPKFKEVDSKSTLKQKV